MGQSRCLQARIPISFTRMRSFDADTNHQSVLSLDSARLSFLLSTRRSPSQALEGVPSRERSCLGHVIVSRTRQCAASCVGPNAECRLRSMQNGHAHATAGKCLAHTCFGSTIVSTKRTVLLILISLSLVMTRNVWFVVGAIWLMSIRVFCFYGSTVVE